VTSPFVDESLSKTIKNNIRELKSPRIYNPRKVVLYLGIVIRNP